MKKMFIVFLLVIVLAFFAGMFFDKIVLTGQAIGDVDLDPYQYSYTTAICTEANECIDFYVVCGGDKVVELEPVTNVVKMPENWQGMRENKTIELCK